MKRRLLATGLGSCVALAVTIAVSGDTAFSHDREHSSESRVRRGFAISPVPLKFHPGNRDLVGLGSYIVNAQASCADCHTCPTYAPGGNPFAGEKTQINGANYLAGGVPFGPFTSANITPDANGLPAGLTLRDFRTVLRTGHNPNDPPNEILQVMPWPILGNMTDRDIQAVYAFLRAIPSAQPGVCTGPGEPAP